MPERQTENVKTWYRSKYKSDRNGKYINPTATFEYLYNGMLRHENFYNLIWVEDERMKTRIQKELAEIYADTWCERDLY